MEQILKKLDRMEQKVDKIETALNLIAVQSERLDTISAQVKTLWGYRDKDFSTDGVIGEIRNFQASCPRKEIKDAFNRQWVTIALLATTVIGIALRVFV